MKKILLDTNILLAPFRFNIDIFAEIERLIDEKYELYVLDKHIEELKFIKKSAKKLKDRMYAKAALQLIESKKIKILHTSGGETDKIILNLVTNDKSWIVATGDKKLKKRLKEIGIDVITIRQKKYLDLERA